MHPHPTLRDPPKDTNELDRLKFDLDKVALGPFRANAHLLHPDPKLPLPTPSQHTIISKFIKDLETKLIPKPTRSPDYISKIHIDRVSVVKQSHLPQLRKCVTNEPKPLFRGSIENIDDLLQRGVLPPDADMTPNFVDNPKSFFRHAPAPLHDWREEKDVRLHSTVPRLHSKESHHHGNEIGKYFIEGYLKERLKQEELERVYLPFLKLDGEYKPAKPKLHYNSMEMLIENDKPSEYLVAPPVSRSHSNEDLPLQMSSPKAASKVVSRAGTQAGTRAGTQAGTRVATPVTTPSTDSSSIHDAAFTLVVSKGKFITSSPQYITFMSKTNITNDRLQPLFQQYETLCYDYSINWMEISCARLEKLGAIPIFKSITRDHLINTLVNRQEVSKLVRKPGQRFKQTDNNVGKIRAATAIQSTWRTYKVRKMFLFDLSRLWVGRCFYKYWRLRNKKKQFQKLFAKKLQACMQPHEQLQSTLKANWYRQYANNPEQMVWIHLPTVTSDLKTREKMKDILHAQQRQIGRCYDLVNPKCEKLVYVLPYKDPNTEVQVKKLCQKRHDKSDFNNFEVFIPEVADWYQRHASLSNMVLCSPITLIQLREMGRDSNSALVPGGLMSGPEIRLSVALKVPIIGPGWQILEPLRTITGIKKFILEVSKDAGLPVLPFASGITSKQELFAQVQGLLDAFPDVPRWVFKVDSEVPASRGFAFINTQDIIKTRAINPNNTLQQVVESCLIITTNYIKSPQHFWFLFLSLGKGGLVEACPALEPKTVSVYTFLGPERVPGDEKTEEEIEAEKNKEQEDLSYLELEYEEDEPDESGNPSAEKAKGNEEPQNQQQQEKPEPVTITPPAPTPEPGFKILGTSESITTTNIFARWGSLIPQQHVPHSDLVQILQNLRPILAKRGIWGYVQFDFSFDGKTAWWIDMKPYYSSQLADFNYVCLSSGIKFHEDDGKCYFDVHSTRKVEFSFLSRVKYVDTKRVIDHADCAKYSISKLEERVAIYSDDFYHEHLELVPLQTLETLLEHKGIDFNEQDRRGTILSTFPTLNPTELAMMCIQSSHQQVIQQSIQNLSTIVQLICSNKIKAKGNFLQNAFALARTLHEMDTTNALDVKKFRADVVQHALLENFANAVQSLKVLTVERHSTMRSSFDMSKSARSTLLGAQVNGSLNASTNNGILLPNNQKTKGSAAISSSADTSPEALSALAATDGGLGGDTYDGFFQKFSKPNYEAVHSVLTELTKRIIFPDYSDGNGPKFAKLSHADKGELIIENGEVKIAEPVYGWNGSERNSEAEGRRSTMASSISAASGKGEKGPTIVVNGSASTSTRNSMAIGENGEEKAKNKSLNGVSDDEDDEDDEEKQVQALRKKLMARKAKKGEQIDALQGIFRAVAK